MKKLVIIGAGSAVFTRGLVADLIANPGDHEWELGLVDINADVLTAVARLAGKMVADSPIAVTASTERREILPGADFVVTTIGVGGRRAWEEDVFVPRKYGVYQPVGDTVMAGGISRGMRMVPALVAIARDVQELCPQAVFFNYANPMAINCAAIRRETGVPVIGLCHGVPDSVRSLARMLDAPEHETTATAVGINHLTFIYELSSPEGDLMSRLRAAIAERRLQPLARDRIGALAWRDGGEEVNPFSWSVFETVGAYPVPGDRHVCEFFADVLSHGRYYGKRFGLDAFSFEDVIEAGDQTHERMMEVGMSDEPLEKGALRGSGGEHEQLVSIIHSIMNDDGSVYSVNLPNGHGYSNLPENALLEQPARATAAGFVPLALDNYPTRCAQIINRHLHIIDLAVEAALHTDKKRMAEAIVAGGYLEDASRVDEMVDELLHAQRAFL